MTRRKAAEAPAQAQPQPQPQRWTSCLLARPAGGTASAASCAATAASASRQLRGAELRCWPQPGAAPPRCVCCVPAKVAPGDASSGSRVAADASQPGAEPPAAGPFVVPPTDAGDGFSSPFRVTLISAVALVGAAVALLTCFYLMRVYQQAARMRELRLSALERRQRRRRRRRVASSSATSAAVPAFDGGGDSGGEGSPRAARPKPVVVVEVLEPGGEVDLGVTDATHATSPAESDAAAAAAPAPVPAAARQPADERGDAAQPAPPPPQVAALEVGPPAASDAPNVRHEAPERPVRDQSARAMLLIARVRRAFDGVGAAARARRRARRDANAAAAPPGAASDRLRAAAAVAEDGTVRITIAREP